MRTLSALWSVGILLALSGCGAPGATSTGDSAGGDPSVVAVDHDLVVAAGATTTWKAGTVVKVAAGASITVKGTLLVQGTAEAPVVIRSAVDPERAGAWGGLVVARGGTLTAKNLELHDASRAFTAQGGSSFDIDGLVVDTSLSVLALAADGTIAHAKLHSQGESQAALPIVVEGASPTLSDALVDQANSLVDQITVDGASSSPVFDHVEVTQSHCAFHFNAGSHVAIRHANVHDNIYGLMVEASSATTVEDSNFEKNVIHIGECYGGSVTLTGDYLDHAAFDASCAAMTDASPAPDAIAGTGPTP